jgi:hypothetical protein
MKFLIAAGFDLFLFVVIDEFFTTDGSDEWIREILSRIWRKGPMRCGPRMLFGCQHFQVACRRKRGKSALNSNRAASIHIGEHNEGSDKAQDEKKYSPQAERR